jgi:hypothetical protein
MFFVGAVSEFRGRSLGVAGCSSERKKQALAEAKRDK